jgi:type II secretory pathway component PulF
LQEKPTEEYIMPLFSHQSFNKKGELISGKIDATSLNAAKDLLRGQGLMPTKILSLEHGNAEHWYSFLFEKNIEFKSIILFTRQLSVLLRSGVPLLQAIELLTEQFDGQMQRVLISIKDGLKSGEPFAAELAKHPRVFSNIYVQLARAGEASGKLEVILDRLTVYLERTEEQKKRIKKAMTYPIVMLCFALLVMVGFIVGILPRMTDMFTKSGQELPGPTQLMINMSDFLTNHYLGLGIGITLFVVSFMYWSRTSEGRLKIDSFLLKAPLLTYFVKTKAVVQFCKTLGMLLESGVHLPEALDIVSNIVDNKVLVHKLSEARDKIIKEGKIAKYLKETGIFPSIASYMISTGEQSGKLAPMLITVGNDYDDELNEIIDGLTAAINPIMTVVLAGIVVFIVLSIFMPIMQMGDIAGI